MLSYAGDETLTDYIAKYHEQERMKLEFTEFLRETMVTNGLDPEGIVGSLLLGNYDKAFRAIETHMIDASQDVEPVQGCTDCLLFARSVKQLVDTIMSFDQPLLKRQEAKKQLTALLQLHQDSINRVMVDSATVVDQAMGTMVDGQSSTLANQSESEVSSAVYDDLVRLRQVIASAIASVRAQNSKAQSDEAIEELGKLEQALTRVDMMDKLILDTREVAGRRNAYIQSLQANPQRLAVFLLVENLIKLVLEQKSTTEIKVDWDLGRTTSDIYKDAIRYDTGLPEPVDSDTYTSFGLLVNSLSTSESLGSNDIRIIKADKGLRLFANMGHLSGMEQYFARITGDIDYPISVEDRNGFHYENTAFKKQALTITEMQPQPATELWTRVQSVVSANLITRILTDHPEVRSEGTIVSLVANYVEQTEEYKKLFSGTAPNEMRSILESRVRELLQAKNLLTEFPNQPPSPSTLNIVPPWMQGIWTNLRSLFVKPLVQPVQQSKSNQVIRPLHRQESPVDAAGRQLIQNILSEKRVQGGMNALRILDTYQHGWELYRLFPDYKPPPEVAAEINESLETKMTSTLDPELVGLYRDMFHNSTDVLKGGNVFTASKEVNTNEPHFTFRAGHMIKNTLRNSGEWNWESATEDTFRGFFAHLVSGTKDIYVLQLDDGASRTRFDEGIAKGTAIFDEIIGGLSEKNGMSTQGDYWMSDDPNRQQILVIANSNFKVEHAINLRYENQNTNLPAQPAPEAQSNSQLSNQSLQSTEEKTNQSAQIGQSSTSLSGSEYAQMESVGESGLTKQFSGNDLNVANSLYANSRVIIINTLEESQSFTIPSIDIQEAVQQASQLKVWGGQPIPVNELIVQAVIDALKKDYKAIEQEALTDHHYSPSSFTQDQIDTFTKASFSDFVNRSWRDPYIAQRILIDAQQIQTSFSLSTKRGIANLFVSIRSRQIPLRDAWRFVMSKVKPEHYTTFIYKNALFFIDPKTGFLAVTNAPGVVPGKVRLDGEMGTGVTYADYIQIGRPFEDGAGTDCSIHKLEDGRLQLTDDRNNITMDMPGFETVKILPRDITQENKPTDPVPPLLATTFISYIQNVIDPQPVFTSYSNTTDRNETAYISMLFPDDKKIQLEYFPNPYQSEGTMTKVIPGEQPVQEPITQAIFGGAETFFAQGKVVLDDGAGEAVALREFAIKYSHTVFIGIDNNYSFQRQVSLRKEGAQLTYDSWDFLSTLPDHSVDSIMSVQAAAMYGEPETVVPALTRVAKPGAVLRLDMGGVRFARVLVRYGWTVYYNNLIVIAQYTHPIDQKIQQSQSALTPQDQTSVQSQTQSLLIAVLANSAYANLDWSQSAETVQMAIRTIVVDEYQRMAEQNRAGPELDAQKEALISSVVSNILGEYKQSSWTGKTSAPRITNNTLNMTVNFAGALATGRRVLDVAIVSQVLAWFSNNPSQVFAIAYHLPILQILVPWLWFGSGFWKTFFSQLNKRLESGTAAFLYMLGLSEKALNGGAFPSAGVNQKPVGDFIEIASGFWTARVGFAFLNEILKGDKLKRLTKGFQIPDEVAFWASVIPVFAIKAIHSMGWISLGINDHMGEPVPWMIYGQAIAASVITAIHYFVKYREPITKTLISVSTSLLTQIKRLGQAVSTYTSPEWMDKNAGTLSFFTVGSIIVWALLHYVSHVF